MIAALDDKEQISRIDKSGMLQVVEKSASQIVEAAKLSVAIKIEKSFDGIIFSGMGGSAISADFISQIFFDTIKKPIFVNRSYVLPLGLGPNNLFIAISYSGETEETLAALKEAENRGMSVICVSTGGKLKEIASSKKFPFVELPLGFQPRAAFYSIFTSLVNILEALELVPDQKHGLEESIRVIEQLRSEIGQSKPERSNDAKQLAQKMKDRIPLIFAGSGITEACGLRMKNQLNENSKIPAFLTVFPELNHNEIVGFAALNKNQHNYVMVQLRDEDENLRIAKRIEITKSLIGVNLGGVVEIKSRGNSRLARLLSLAFYADLLSCYVAIAREVDPTPVDVITRLKKELKR